MSSMDWLRKLAEYYAHSKPPKIRVEMLAKRFMGESEAVMENAILRYMDVGQYFPQISDLLPFVKTAQFDESASHMTAAERFKVYALKLPICPECGERTPSLEDCPFCADMQAARAELVAAGFYG